jgi:hypothetical protein
VLAGGAKNKTNQENVIWEVFVAEHWVIQGLASGNIGN